MERPAVQAIAGASWDAARLVGRSKDNHNYRKSEQWQKQQRGSRGKQAYFTQT
jgi:hypothetical protein